MEKNLVKVKRKRVSWIKILHSFTSPVMENYYFALCKKLRRGKSLSSNRCAYYTLKHFYSTTTIEQLLRKCNEF